MYKVSVSDDTEKEKNPDSFQPEPFTVLFVMSAGAKVWIIF